MTSTSSTGTGSGAQELMAFQEIRAFLGIGEHWGFLEEASILILRCSLLYLVRQ